MKKLFPSNDVNKYSEIYSLLGYKEVKRTRSVFPKLDVVTYEKERDVANYNVLKDKYAPHSIIPFFFVILFVAIAIACATAYLIINFISKEIDKVPYFFMFMLPTSISTLIATAICFIRYFTELKNIQKIASIPLLKKEVNAYEEKK